MWERRILLTAFFVSLAALLWIGPGQAAGECLAISIQEEEEKAAEKEKKTGTTGEHFWNVALDLIQKIRRNRVPLIQGMEEMDQLMEKVKEKRWYPYLLFFKGSLYYEFRRYDEALGLFTEMEREFSGHFLNTRILLPDENSLLQRAISDCRRQIDWRKNHPVEMVDPKVDPSRLVSFETELGSFRIGFFSDVAPEHTENFLKLCKEGYYDNTYFFLIEKDVAITGGCSNTKDDNVGNDGKGTPGYTLEPRIVNIRPSRGRIAMCRYQRHARDHGSQFTILNREAHNKFRKATFFGEVIEGMDVVDKIANSKLNILGWPESPIRIKKVIVEESR